IGMLLVLPVLGVIVRYGFVAGIVTFGVHFLTKNVPLSLDGSRLYFADGIAIAAIVTALAVAGFVLARAREPFFGGLIKMD
ncbi:MAG TPA: hypothetical protein VMW48_05880, partial [Vicinamibacterales bacterium]|nr:hypothetical protein [Vicinamibacterales bacterium]